MFEVKFTMLPGCKSNRNLRNRFTVAHFYRKYYRPMSNSWDFFNNNSFSLTLSKSADREGLLDMGGSLGSVLSVRSSRNIGEADAWFMGGIGRGVMILIGLTSDSCCSATTSVKYMTWDQESWQTAMAIASDTKWATVKQIYRRKCRKTVL